MKRALSCLLAVALALAGCAVPAAAPDGGDPGTDRLGWENGYWYDDPVAVEAADGLNDSEREAVLARAMARLERLRSLEFEDDVDVRLIGREQYRQSRGDSESDPWNDQVWEALFLVGENTSVAAAFDDTLGGSVLGYYRAGSNELVLVGDSEAPAVDRDTLVHELVHALQDQQFGLGGVPETQDRQLARNGVVEGEANLLESRYRKRCGERWSCIETPESGATGGGSVNRGVLLVILAPYVAGPEFVAAVERRGGWRAVDDLHDSFPASTAQVLDPATYPDATPVSVSVPDRSSGSWTRFDHDPVADTVGQASIHAAFVDNGVGASDVGRYTYDHPAADGWAGDTLVPYRDGERYGYVWETAWRSERDAREFERTYRDLLESKEAQFREGGLAVVPDGAYADAFRVTRTGTRVRVVNGPTVDALSAIHPG
jgi:hypothetical protein